MGTLGQRVAIRRLGGRSLLPLKATTDQYGANLNQLDAPATVPPEQFHRAQKPYGVDYGFRPTSSGPRTVMQPQNVRLSRVLERQPRSDDRLPDRRSTSRPFVGCSVHSNTLSWRHDLRGLYGGVQSARSGQQQALFNQAMAQEQLRQQALARQIRCGSVTNRANLDRQLRVADMLERA